MLLTALVRLNLLFHAGAKRFASVTSAPFIESLHYEDEAKVRVLEGPWRSVTLQRNGKTTM